MLRLFARCNNILHINNTKHVRTFLSEAYKCTEAWNNRLTSPILQKVRIEELYNTIDQRFSRQEVVSSIDIEIFANAASGSYLNELRDLLYKLRLTLETSNSLESTQYAVVKCFMESKNYKELIDILDDRLNYGVFLNEFTGNILLDELIKENDYPSAAKVASFFMLQEDFENNEITENLCAFACYKYLSELKLEEVMVEDVKEVVVEAPIKKKKKEEEIKIRVRFLRNPYFDDHFDLTDLKLLAGKTLASIPYKKSDSLSLNCQLIGWFFYKKIDKVRDLAKHIQHNKLLLNDTVRIIKSSLENPFIKDDPEVSEAYKEILSSLESSDCLETSDSSMDEKLTENVKESLRKSEQENIQRHSQLFTNWEKLRETSLAEQLKRLEDSQISQERKAKVDELRLLDEKIWFFDNEEKFNLKIRTIEPRDVKVSNKKSKAIDENYIPPEVKPRRSV